MAGKRTKGQHSVGPPNRQPARPNKKRRTGKLGPLLKAARENRAMKRSEVIKGVYQAWENLEPESEEEDSVRGEAWLARVENNNNTISARDLELLFRAMNCSYAERTRILVDGERTPLITAAGQEHVVAAFLTFAMLTIYDHPEVAKMIMEVVDDQRVYTLDQAEVWEIFSEILTMVKPPLSEAQQLQRTDINLKRAGRL